ncbi:hypothetical protein P0136_11530 [Lentisphaerota bacterium ZTH]|nr:hypothetical protein JYG24_10950 [Lentisphaerota bacterium]WET05988.1 hypothetical protein P0136_11530 [Lentisphaerota bacterium ZTH]
MNKFFFLSILSCCVLANAKVQISEIKVKKSLVACSVRTKYFRAFLVNPAKYNSAKYCDNSLRGGWFKNFIIKNADSGIMGTGESPFADYRFGLAQAFEPEIELTKGLKEAVLPGIGIAAIENNTIAKIKDFFPWTFNISQNSDKSIVSFSQSFKSKTSDTAYKLRIDCVFQDSAEVIIKGVFLNTGKQEIRGGICPMPIFKRGLEKKCWISVPHIRSRKIKKKRWNYINTNPLSVEKMRDYYEFSSQRLSKAKRWIAAGGMQDKELMVFVSARPLDKVLFWKTPGFFSISPMINIRVAPGKRLTWKWKYIFGRGLDRIDAVLKTGLLSCEISPRSSTSKYFKGRLKFLPYKETRDITIDAIVKNSRRRIISTGTYDMLQMSPLQPDYANIKLNKRFRKNRRYLMEIEIFKDNSLIDSNSDFLYP